MKKVKRIISMMLVLATMLTFAPMSKAANISETAFANKIAQLQSVYKQGQYWNEYNSCKSNGTGTIRCSGSAEGMTCINRGYCGGSSGAGCTCTCGAYYENGVAVAWQCMGFAYKMGYEVFGDYISSSAWETSYSLGTIYAGDIIRIKNQHSIFVIKVVGETVYYADCNRTGPCQVDWTGSYTKSQIASFFNYKKHYKGNTLTGTGSSGNVHYDSISTGYYTLTNVGSGSILNVSGGTDADQTNVTGGTWNPGHQRLYISPATTGYKMKPVCSSRLINAWGDNPGNGANVNIYKDCNESSQWWLFEKVNDGYVIHLAHNPSLVLTYWASSNNVAVATYASGDTRQIWKLDPSNEFTVSYNANGGTGAPAAQKMYQGRETALSSAVPTRSGYTFNGWNTKADGTGTAYSAGGTIVLNSNVTLYAQWKSDSYTLTYDSNGGTGAPSAQTVTKGGTIVIPSTVPTRSGYTFNGWNTKADGSGDSYDKGNSITLNSNVTLYAEWEIICYGIRYEANGGDSPVDYTGIAGGGFVTLPTPTKYVTITYNANGGKNAPSATKAYYECLGWSKSSTATTATYKCGEQYNVTEDVTLYAVWANKAYTNLSSSVPTRDGYNFLGWATSSSATQAQFAPGINVNLGIDTTLYAVWQKVETPTPPAPSVPSITEQDVSLTYKDSMTFNVPVTLETSDSGVASVSGNKISAVGTGSADVTVTFEDGSVCVYHINVSYAWWQWIIIIVLFGWAWY